MSDERHVNFSRDLIRDPLAPSELAKLAERQGGQGSGAAIAMAKRTAAAGRACVVCAGSVSVMRRRDSPTCSRRCAATLRQRRRSVETQAAPGNGESPSQPADSEEVKA
jgi:hypothetical protein